MPSERTAAVIVAGGGGERFGRSEGKQLALAAGRPVLSWTVEAFALAPEIELIVVVCPENRFAEYRAAAMDGFDLEKPMTLAASGVTRQDSVASGLAALPAEISTVAVHDGARPLVTPALISAVIAALNADPVAGGAVVGHSAVDTIKVVADGTVIETPDRSTLWAIQTPQVFRLAALVSAYESAARDGFTGTDDASLLERVGARVVLVEGPRDNLKVTHAEDLAFVEQLLAGRAGGA